MTREEAERLAKVFETVDGGCSNCIRAVCSEANKAELGFYWAPDEYAYNVSVVTEPPNEDDA